MLIIDLPNGGAYGFPCKVDEDTFRNADKLRVFVLSKGYPEKKWTWAKNFLTVSRPNPMRGIPVK